MAKDATDNVIYQLCRKFALRIVNLYVYLREEKREFVIAKQICRCGTSIGANVAESLFAQSNADYISKLSIALKEASETKYWLDLLADAGLITEKQHSSLAEDAKTIIGTLIIIINKLKSKK